MSGIAIRLQLAEKGTSDRSGGRERAPGGRCNRLSVYALTTSNLPQAVCPVGATRPPERRPVSKTIRDTSALSLPKLPLAHKFLACRAHLMSGASGVTRGRKDSTVFFAFVAARSVSHEPSPSALQRSRLPDSTARTPTPASRTMGQIDRFGPRRYSAASGATASRRAFRGRQCGAARIRPETPSPAPAAR